MKTLLILRHAKSSRENLCLDDFDRPLNGRGRQAALAMGKYLNDRGSAPELVLCSAAQRARETWNLVARSIEREPPCKLLRSLYLASATRILQTVQGVPDEVGRLLVIGHNPGFQRLAARLTGPESAGQAYEDLTGKFPTAALAVLTSDVATWGDLAFGQARLTAFVKPPDLE